MRKQQKTLADELEKASNKVNVGGTYYHYKNTDNSYTVLNLAVMESDGTVCVIYRADYGDQLIFVRPLENWLDLVERNGQQVKRFTLLG